MHIIHIGRACILRSIIRDTGGSTVDGRHCIGRECTALVAGRSLKSVRLAVYVRCAGTSMWICCPGALIVVRGRLAVPCNIFGPGAWHDHGNKVEAGLMLVLCSLKCVITLPHRAGSTCGRIWSLSRAFQASTHFCCRCTALVNASGRVLPSIVQVGIMAGHHKCACNSYGLHT